MPMLPDIDRLMLLLFVPKATGNGTLTMYQQGEDGLPFAPKKVLVVKGMRPDDVRGRHAHRETDEVVAVLQGGCDVEVTDGERTTATRIAADGSALFLPAKLWRTLKNFAPDTILLIIANRNYDEQDYIRSYDEFLALRSKAS